jgi:dTDP-4-amino-4,6-dideoxygalactose transaminase
VPTRYAAVQSDVTLKELKPFAGVPLGGFKYRMMQFASALGRVQLRVYDKQIAEIQKAMNHFWDLLEGVPGLRAHRPPQGSGSTMGGWYAARGLYVQEELGGLPLAKFCEAVTAEGAGTSPGANFPLNTHAVFREADVYHEGRPTNLAHTRRKLNQGEGTMPVSESIFDIAYGVPWFRRYRPRLIKQYANAYRKVAEHADELR